MKEDYNSLVSLMMGESTDTTPKEPKIIYAPMNEVYLGGSTVSGIQSVMDQIVKAFEDDPSLIMLRHPLNKKLEDEIQKAFGFKYVRIEWHTGTGMQLYTLSPEKFGHMTDKSFKQGTHQKGFYDKDHKMTVCILMDSGLFTQLHLTSREAVALLLHEIGHNFDITPFTLLSAGFNIVQQLISIGGNVMLLRDSDVPNKVKTAVRAGQLASYFLLPLELIPFTRPVALAIHNLGDHILSHFPTIETLAYRLKITVADVAKLISGILSPVSFVLGVKDQLLKLGLIIIDPVYFAFTAPLKAIVCLMNKHMETYADSFAATYGYGADLAFANEKRMHGKYRPTSINSPEFMEPFFDLAYAYDGILNLISLDKKHPGNIKRVRRMIDKLERDVNKNNVDPTVKKELKLKVNELNKAYDDIIEAGETKYSFISRMYTKLMSAYYDSSLSKLFDTNDSFAE